MPVTRLAPCQQWKNSPATYHFFPLFTLALQAWNGKEKAWADLVIFTPWYCTELRLAPVLNNSQPGRRSKMPPSVHLRSKIQYWSAHIFVACRNSITCIYSVFVRRDGESGACPAWPLVSYEAWVAICIRHIALIPACKTGITCLWAWGHALWRRHDPVNCFSKHKLLQEIEVQSCENYIPGPFCQYAKKCWTCFLLCDQLSHWF